MKKKVLVTYSCKYTQEIDLEIDEETNELLEENRIIDYIYYDNSFLKLETQPEISDLPIPELTTDFKKVEYIDGSFDVVSFEKAE